MMQISGTLILALSVLLLPANRAVADVCTEIEMVETFASRKVAPEGATCFTFQDQSARMGVSCFWEYPFRDVAANHEADRLWSLIQSCHDGTQNAPDLQVNHPDSYKLREWSVGSDTFRIAVKDKGSQQRTLVFLRIN